MNGHHFEPRWAWEAFDFDRAAAAGDFGKLLSNWEEKKPGFLARSAPGLNAYVMAREVIQNAWDAAKELQESPPPPPPQKRAPDFHISFRFRNLDGPEKRGFTSTLDLHGHADRLSRLDRSRFRLSDDLCLDHLDEPKPLPLLIIEETATTGMYGSWEQGKSKLYEALCALGIGKDPQIGAGGSFGYGKAALIRGSALRIVIAYTCFRDPEEPRVTRRLLGATYWGVHEVDGVRHLGMARWGNGTRPLENDAADEAAHRLGIRLRDPNSVADRGSTFLLVEPTVEPEALQTAVNRSWWPALEDRDLGFHVSITGADGAPYDLRPSVDADLLPFVRAYRHAISASKSLGRPVNFHKYPIGPKDRIWGHLVLADDRPWSYPDRAESDDRDETLVAIMREPRMVVEYLKKRSGHTQTPILRGAFVAHSRANESLAKTEPFGHDSWDHKGDAPEEARRVAQTIKDQINTRILALQKKLKPPPPEPERPALPEFDKIMRRILGGRGRSTPPPHPPRTVRIFDIEHQPESVGAGQIRTVGSARFRLTEHVLRNQTTAHVQVAVRFFLLEDEGSRGDTHPVTVTPPEGFVVEDENDEGQSCLGSLAGDEIRRFTFETEPYDAEWTGRIAVAAGIVRPREAR